MMAHASGARPGVVLTFEPHPSRVLRPDAPVPLIMTGEQKERAVAASGADVLATLRFDAALAALSAELFAGKVLAAALRARVVAVGENFRFGQGRSAGVDELRALGAAHGFELIVVPPVEDNALPVSSSRIREALLSGEVEDAARLLGRPFEICGTVVAGDGRGRTIGIPTANIASENDIAPKNGVYAALLSGPTAGTDRPAVVNIGTRPTFAGRSTTIEAHVLDFDAAFYEERVSLRFAARLRDEQRFAGAAELVAQIRADIERARPILSRSGAAKI